MSAEERFAQLPRAAMRKSRAILIRRYLLGESSLIVHWCTADHGLLKTVARGARRPKSPFAGRLDLFFTADIAWSPSRRSDLHTLTEATLVAPRLGLRDSYGRTLAAAYFTSMVDLVVEREAPVPEFHDLLGRALDWLDSHEPTAAAVRRFEDHTAVLLGIAPRGAPGAAFLLDVFHRLPPQRDDLFALFA